MRTADRYYLICMSFDGEYQVERPFFDTIQEAQEYSNDLGSKWYFYPYHFVCKGKTVKETGYGLTHLENLRIKTVAEHFNALYEHCEENNITMNAEEYWFAL